MEVYVDLNNVSKLLPAVLDRMTEMNRLEAFEGLLKAIGEGILQNDIAFDVRYWSVLQLGFDYVYAIWTEINGLLDYVC